VVYPRDWPIPWSHAGIGCTGFPAGWAGPLWLRYWRAKCRYGPTVCRASPPPHFPPKARRAIHIYLCGGLSQIDSFDYKPALAELHGKSLSTDERPDVFFAQVGLLRKNDWAFQQRGQSGLWISELFPHIGGVADELTVIRSMFAETSNHTPATFQANTGFRLNGFPTLGAWLSYGLGNETEDLPAYVVIPDTRGQPAGGSINWSNGFLSARHQGTLTRSKGPAIHARQKRPRSRFPPRPKSLRGRFWRA
jgi:Protein of unknown function (DUF1501)